MELRTTGKLEFQDKPNPRDNGSNSSSNEKKRKIDEKVAHKIERVKEWDQMDFDELG